VQGVVYRDLKPENILLDSKGHIKLADFGLAKENITEATAGAHSLCGTPEYLSPEVLDRQGHGTAVDWWNLGMVTFEMLTGLPPWYTTDKQKLFERLRNAPLKFPFYVSKSAASFIYVSAHNFHNMIICIIFSAGLIAAKSGGAAGLSGRHSSDETSFFCRYRLGCPKQERNHSTV
jgi:serine/threonine protein kinase